MPTGSFADRVRRWERLVQALAPNAPDMPGVADSLKELEDVLQRTKDLQKQEDATQAQFRDTIALRQAIDNEGEDLRMRIMHSLKGRYGFRADKLYEFGMRPARQRRSKKTPQTNPPPATPPPVVPPAQPADPHSPGSAAEPLTK